MLSYFLKNRFVAILGLVAVAGLGAFAILQYRNTDKLPVRQEGSQKKEFITQVIRYSPKQKATNAYKGECWTGSLAIPFRSDAWRCTVPVSGIGIIDPCFVFEKDINLVCDANPASKGDEFILSLTSRLPLSEANQDRQSPN